MPISRHAFTNSAFETRPLWSVSKPPRHAAKRLPNLAVSSRLKSSSSAAPLSKPWNLAVASSTRHRGIGSTGTFTTRGLSQSPGGPHTLWHSEGFRPIRSASKSLKTKDRECRFSLERSSSNRADGSSSFTARADPSRVRFPVGVIRDELFRLFASAIFLGHESQHSGVWRSIFGFARAASRSSRQVLAARSLLKGSHTRKKAFSLSRSPFAGWKLSRQASTRVPNSLSRRERAAVRAL
mmetsp:Transcript_57747/g.124877  ORF Transcript_57747/g.124877 Transcript_57747/m.124877 type:complete len:239 (-) Transcript_57747:2025-2741(-)